MSANSLSHRSASKTKWTHLGRTFGFCGLFLTSAAYAVAHPRQTSPAPSSESVIVAEVPPGSPAAKAGLRVNDTLLSYGGHALTSPFAFIAAEGNATIPSQATLKVRRGSQMIELTMPAGESKLIVQPVLSPEAASLWRAGLVKFDAKEWEAATTQWQAAWKIVDAAGDKKVCAWLCGWIATGYRKMALSISPSANLGERFRRIKNLMETLTWTHRAWEDVKDGEDRAAKANILLGLGTINLNFSDLNHVEAAFPWLEQAYSAAVQDGDELWAALAHDMQGLILLSRYAPGSPSFRKQITTKTQDLTQSRLYCSDALKIRQRLLPASLLLAESFRHVGNVAIAQGEWTEGQTYYEQAIRLYRQLAPKSMDLAGMLAEAGELAMLHGDAVNGRRYYREALDLYQGAEISYQPMQATTLWSLGVAFAMQGDLLQAKQYIQKARDTYPKTAFDYQMQEANCLMTLGVIAAAEHDLPQAKQFCEQALTLLPGKSTDFQEGRAAALNTLGLLATFDNQLAKARNYYEEALSIWQARKFDFAGMTVSLDGLGMVAMAEGRLAEAQAKFEQAQAVLRLNAVGTSQEAAFLANMGRLHLLQKQPEKALPALEEAATVLETRRQHIPDLDSRALFLQLYGNPFADLIRATWRSVSLARHLTRLNVCMRAPSRTIWRNGGSNWIGICRKTSVPANRNSTTRGASAKKTSSALSSRKKQAREQRRRLPSKAS